VVAPDAAAEIARVYREEANRDGRSPSPEDVLYRARIYVADTDQEAEDDVQTYRVGDMRSRSAPAAERAEAASKILGALFGGRGGHQATPTPRPEFSGSPASVARQLRESRELIGWGILDAMFTDHRLPHEKARRSLELFATEVLPQLRSEAATVS
jgi:alkanesulfonate monooxygenase SsuD/methylene tetrahydromethanopterin reductase-like flavin-dependent oxidoreductase (luciferase family)